jgi:aspartate/methionine/tyrosine aminotransferase
VTRHPAIARPEVLALRGSKIREVANAAMGRPDVLPFWFGESDQPTSASIRGAAIAALQAGQTFYSHNLGQPALRAAIAAYLSGLHESPIGEARLAITNSGVSALMIAAQAVISPGDRVVVVDPVWPNVAEIPRILGAEVAYVSLRPGPDGFRLDLDQLLDALTPDTRALFLNSPNNPTGWTIDPDQRQPILERCRALGVWLVADDVYERLYFGDRASAPSFLPLATPQDRLISANSFSKAWRMTGWRLGWLVAPPTLVERLGVLLEYNTSCAPDFVQAAAMAAIEGGEPDIQALKRELATARDHLIAGLRAIPGVIAPKPAGAMYAFFRLAEEPGDSVALAKRLVNEAGLGLAPGAAFGEGGEGWLRWCFAADQSRLDEGLARLRAYLARSGNFQH